MAKTCFFLSFFTIVCSSVGAQKSADWKFPQDTGEWSLKEAVLKGRGSSYIDTLKSRGVDLNALSTHGRTALYMAAINGYPNTIEALIDRGADVNKVSTGRQTPLMGAVFGGKLPVVKLLIRKAADSELMAETGETALQIAQRLKIKKIADFLDTYEQQKDGTVRCLSKERQSHLCRRRSCAAEQGEIQEPFGQVFTRDQCQSYYSSFLCLDCTTRNSTCVEDYVGCSWPFVKVKTIVAPNATDADFQCRRNINKAVCP